MWYERLARKDATRMAQTTQRKIRANNIDFEIVEAGEGPLILCLHGFPDTPDSFREQIPVLVKSGFHVAAPFLRGYRPTGPAADGRYDPAAIAEDAVALIGALGYKEAIVFGH